jgi:hypothetical protein
MEAGPPPNAKQNLAQTYLLIRVKKNWQVCGKDYPAPHRSFYEKDHLL